MSEAIPSVLGRYSIAERLAVGGMAELFLAQVTGDHGFARTVVVKRLLGHMASNAHFRAMFIDEAKLTAQLVHPKIAQTYELGNEDGQLYIVMEFVDGIDALAMLRECAHRRIRVPQEVAVYITHEILDALDFAHNKVDASGRAMGIVHRDISPSNVLLSRRGDVKLVDFGIARASEQQHHTKAGTLKGKYGYMSPEQVVGTDVDARSDVFSVGICLAELLTGRRLFAAPNELDVLLMVRDAKLDRLERFGKRIEPDLRRILDKSLSKTVEQRHASAAEFRDELGEWLFEHRHRVTPKAVAHIVGSLYDDAWQRKRDALTAASAGADSSAGASEPAPREQGADAIPDGTAAGIEMPIISIEDVDSVGPQGPAAQAVGEVVSPSQGEDSVTRRHRAPTPRLAQAPVVAGEGTEPERAAQLLEDVEIDDILVDLEDVADDQAEPQVAPSPPPVVPIVPAPTPRAEAPSVRVRQATETPSEVIDIELGPPGSPQPLMIQPLLHADERADTAPSLPESTEQADELVLLPNHDAAGGGVVEVVAEQGDSVDKSTRYPSISAAVASVSVLDPDPSAIDFDDRLVTDAGNSVRSQKFKRPIEGDFDDSEPPEPPRLHTIVEEPDDAGQIETTPAIRVLYRLCIGKESGLLVVNCGAIRKEIYVAKGKPEFVSSNVASELFGEYLVKKRALSSGELAMALAMMPHYGGKLGDTLVGLALMKPLEVFRMLTQQVRDKLVDVCTWTKGTFAWHNGKENPREAFPLDLDPLEVIGAGASTFPASLLEQWANDNNSLRPRSAKNPHIGPELFQLGTGPRDIYNSLDGARSMESLLERYTSERPRLEFLRILFLLVQTDLAMLT